MNSTCTVLGEPPLATGAATRGAPGMARSAMSGAVNQEAKANWEVTRG